VRLTCTRLAKNSIFVSNGLAGRLGDFTQCGSSWVCGLWKPPTAYLPRITSIPASIDWSFAGGSFPTQSSKTSRSSATSCETLATESRGRPVIRRIGTLPGASAQRMLVVRGTHKTVEILLRLKASPCTTTTGRRYPGPDPTGFGRSAHLTSPCEITTRFFPAFDGSPPKRTHRSAGPTQRRLYPSLR
jgi:hypothetical protein